MRALVIYETMFGNTGKIAHAIAEGLSAESEVIIAEVVDAPADVPADIDVLLVGGPTHVFSMSRGFTRADAAHRGGGYADVPGGIREWLSAQPRGEHPQTFIAFDTRADMPLLPGAASRSATRVARQRGFTVGDPESFLVEGYEGPLVVGELERAREWGRSISARYSRTDTAHAQE